MKIYKRIKRGVLKGYTIRKSKYGWYALYSQNGVCQSLGEKTLTQLKELIKLKVKVNNGICFCENPKIEKIVNECIECGNIIYAKYDGKTQYR